MFGHMMGGCFRADTKKQYVAWHDKAILYINEDVTAILHQEQKGWLLLDCRCRQGKWSKGDWSPQQESASIYPARSQPFSCRHQQQWQSFLDSQGIRLIRPDAMMIEIKSAKIINLKESDKI